jgi:hypothetical protein
MNGTDGKNFLGVRLEAWAGPAYGLQNSLCAQSADYEPIGVRKHCNRKELLVCVSALIMSSILSLDHSRSVKQVSQYLTYKQALLEHAAIIGGRWNFSWRPSCFLVP